jgi:hypothetical protein
MDKINRYLPFIIWIGVLVCFGVYLNVARIIYIEPDFVKTTVIGNVQIIFISIGVFTSIISLFLNYKIHTSIDFLNNKVIKAYTKIELNVDSFDRLFFIVYSLSLGFLNVTALLGLIIFLQIQNVEILLIINSIAFSVWILSFPKKKKIAELKNLLGKQNSA